MRNNSERTYWYTRVVASARHAVQTAYFYSKRDERVVGDARTFVNSRFTESLPLVLPINLLHWMGYKLHCYHSFIKLLNCIDL